MVVRPTGDRAPGLVDARRRSVTTKKTARRWLIVEVAEQAFGLDVEAVQELIDLGGQPVHRLPESNPHLLGVLRVRDAVVPLVDFRRLIGVPSMQSEVEEVIKLLHQRRQDHINWLKELEASVNESRPFGLATDPHACAFGEWYDRLMGDRKALDRFTSGNLALLTALESFDLCHKRIHAIAEQVTQLVDRGDIEGARKVIDATRHGDLKRMLDLFDRVCELVASVRRARVVLVRVADHVAGLAVDEVCQVTELPPDSYRDVGVGQSGGLVDRLATDTSDRLVQLVNLESLERTLGHEPVAAS